MHENGADIMLVDCDPDALHVMPKFLARSGRLRVAASVCEGCRQVDRQAPDLLIIDPHLPDGSGTQVLQSYVERSPWPVTLVTHRVGDSEPVLRLIAAGASDFLNKPFDIAELPGRVAGLLRYAEEKREAFLRAQELRTRLEHMDRVALLGTLVATVVHEAANPVGAIGLNARLLLDVAESRDELALADVEFAREALRDILTATSAVTSFLATIRAFSRRQEDPRVEEPLDKVIQTAARFVRPRLMRAATQLHLPSPCPCALPHHPTRLIQALTNAMANAIDAGGPAGNMWVRIEPGPAEVAVVVEDDGPGLTEPVMARFGEPFFTTKPNGTGLGIRVMKSVMADHGGRVEFMPRHGGPGLCVRLVLPRTPPEAPAEPSEREAAPRSWRTSSLPESSRSGR